MMKTFRSNVSKSKLALVALLATAMALPMAASAAKRKVVILNFQGPGARPMQKAIAKRLLKRFRLVGQGNFVKAAKKLGVRGAHSSDDITKISSVLGADALLTGRVRKAKRGFELALTVRDGGTGLEVEQIRIPLKKKRLDAKALAKIDSKLIPALESVQGHKAAEEPVAEKTDEPPVETPPSVPESSPESSPPSSNQMSDLEGAPQQQPPREVTEEPEITGAGRPSFRPWLSLTVFAGARLRNLTFEAPVALQGYEGAMVADIGLMAEINPFYKGFLRGLGLFLSYDRPLSVSTKYRVQGMADESVDSSQQAFVGGLQYGYRFREHEESATIGLRAGYGLHAFEINVPQALVGRIRVPDVNYKYADLGLYLLFPLGPRFEVDLRFSYLAVLSSGMITAGGRVTDPNTGAMSLAPGPNGSSSGLGGELVLKYRMARWFNLQLRGELQRFATSFTAGTGVNAQSATDMFYRFGLGFGFEF